MLPRRAPGAIPAARTMLLGVTMSGVVFSCGLHSHGLGGATTSATTGMGTGGSAVGTGGAGGMGSSGSTGGTGGAGATGGAGGMGTTGGMGGMGGMPAMCGDGHVEGTEVCDDGNMDLGDGCGGCTVEAGFTCTGIGTNPTVCTPIPPQVVTVGPGLGMDITDQKNHYKGTLQTMDCATLTFADQGFPSVKRVSLTVGIDHTFVGDLVLKVMSPQGTVLTIFSRPGLDEDVDTYDEGDGDSSLIQAVYPITFRDGESDDAEKMGNGITDSQVVCKDDQRCIYAPNPGKGPGHNFTDFDGQSPAGDWKVCLADGDNNDTGKLQLATLSILAW